METLTDIIKQQIRLLGPMDVAQFMQLALHHPTHGYYAQNYAVKSGQPDFVTSPELSQIFGEMVGLYLAQVWLDAGSPGQAILLECGPGQGTLMADILRATRHVSGFHAALDVHMLEVSVRLQKRQAERIAPIHATWHITLETIPTHLPWLVVGNEFFDALPIHQYERIRAGTWAERVLNLDVSDHLTFGLKATAQNFDTPFDFIEVSPASQAAMIYIANHLKSAGGTALFFDYGGRGRNSLRAYHHGQLVDVLSQIGACDITANVDFDALAKAVHQSGVCVLGAIPQHVFLSRMGADSRFEQLMVRAKDILQRKTIETAYSRLQHDLGPRFTAFGASGWPASTFTSSLFAA